MRNIILAAGLFLLVTAPTAAQEMYWKDQRIMQLEEITPQLVDAVTQLHEQISSVAISSITFGDSLPDNFRKVATARLHQSLTQLSQLKVSICETCSQIKTTISGSYLKISRGIADDEFRRKTANELSVSGFVDIAVFMSEDRQLSISLNAYEAQNGEIVYSKIISGEPAKKENYLHVYLGKLLTSITHSSTNKTAISHQANLLGAEQVLRLTQDWTFTGGAALFSDDNTNLTTKYEKSVNGFLVDGSIGYDLFGFGGNQAALTLSGGLGMMIAAALNSPPYFKFGASLSVAEKLSLGYNFQGTLMSSDTFKMPYFYTLTLGWNF